MTLHDSVYVLPVAKPRILTLENPPGLINKYAGTPSVCSLCGDVIRRGYWEMPNPHLHDGPLAGYGYFACDVECCGIAMTIFANLRIKARELVAGHTSKEFVSAMRSSGAIESDWTLVKSETGTIFVTISPTFDGTCPPIGMVHVQKNMTAGAVTKPVLVAEFLALNS